MKMLDLFCGRGGWSKAFAAVGWECTGVDLHELGYPFKFVRHDCLSLSPVFIESFDAVCSSPPCEDFARAWLPWLRGDHRPSLDAIRLVEWSVKLCDRPGRITECSRFSARHIAGAAFHGSYALWGDVPPVVPVIRGKMRKTGKRPDLRAEIPFELADCVRRHFSP